MPKSAVNPKTFFIRKKELIGDNIILTIRARWDVQPETIPDEKNNSTTIYDYQEEEFTYKISVNDIVLNGDDFHNQLSSLLNKKKDDLLKKAQKIRFIKQSLS